MSHRLLMTSIASVIAALSIGCGNSDDESDDSGDPIASSGNAALVIYADPYAPDRAGTPNPIASSAAATAEAFDVGGKLHLMLSARGLPANRPFGAHLHKLACNDPAKAGGHYQHVPLPAGGMATDPAYANAMNEAWLDFSSDSDGTGQAEVMSDWLPRHDEARAIIIHDMQTAAGGVAGPKLACLPITGF